ncbi:hypothetical protein QN277_004270 [Acacia crassicarpa]|uniref:TORTIFOLIA1/SINE1-2 N-terminal domain-containing protein n=1 Tax=Acacia crassicarpa TaxID=499986 RepID=A0AAE1K121_9FABA|nr:hypothetical protein QN277_004270 [Acacia crassicarpa]
MSVPSRRHSLSPSQLASSSPGSTHDLKQRVIAGLNKLSDRDTLAVAVAELESIARTLNQDSFSLFLNCIYNTDSSCKSPVRKQCVHLLTFLSHFHGDSLSPHLSKMISTVLRRLRDPDSVVRSACVEAVTAMSSRITKPPFTAAFLKPLMEALTQEQDVNSQIGSALCLAAAIESAPEPDVEALRKSTLPKLGKLAKNEVCKAKAALLVLIGSVVGVGGASSRGVLNWLVPCLLEFLSNEDWTVRKAAAEGLGKVASAEKYLASQYKVLCLDSLQNRRFDKVKVVRETMNRTLETWKEVTDASEDVSPPAKSVCSTVGPDDDNDQCDTASSVDAGFKSTLSKKTVQANRSPSSTVSVLSTIKRMSPQKGNDKNLSMGLPRKLDHEKCSDSKPETPQSKSSTLSIGKEDNIKKCNSEVSKPAQNEDPEKSRAEIKRVVFSKMSDEKLYKFGGPKSGSRVVPISNDDNPDLDVKLNCANEVCDNPQDVEDFSLIREQLIQIENQQSNLLDLLQRFIGSSQSGMNSLETRVHGVEMALDEILHDLAVSSGRISNTDATEDTCCKLPGSDFLSSKLWRKTEGRYSPSRIFLGSISSPNAMHNANNKDSVEMPFNSKRFLHRMGGSSVNSMAETEGDLKGHLGQYRHNMPKNISQDAGKTQSNNASGLDSISLTSRTSLRNQKIRSSV